MSQGKVYFKNGTVEDILFYRRHSFNEKVIFYTKDKTYFYNEMVYRTEKYSWSERQFYEMYITVDPFAPVPVVRWLEADDIQKIELFDEERREI